MVKYPKIKAEEVSFRENFINSTYVSDNGLTLIDGPVVNNGLTVNGTSQYASTPFNFDDLDAFSIEAVFSVTANDVSWQPIICNEFNAAVGLMLSVNLDRVSFNIPSGAYEGLIADDIPIQANTIYHVVATFDGTNSLIYVNGQLDTATGAFTKSSSGGKLSSIGAAVTGGDYDAWSSVELGGTIYYVNVYDKVLSAEEVADRSLQDTFSEIDAKQMELSLPLRSHYDDGGTEVTANNGTMDSDQVLWGNGSTATTYPTLLDNNGASFDGGDYIKVNTPVPLTDITNQISCGALIRMEIVDNYQSICENERNWYLFTNNVGRLTFAFNDAGGAYHKYIVGTTNLQKGVWYYVVASYDGSDASSGISIYINGVKEVASNANWDAGLTDNSTRLAFGIGGNLSTYPFEGAMKFPFVSTKEITETQAKWLSERAFKEFNI